MERMPKALASTDPRSNAVGTAKREGAELIVSGVGIGVLGTVAAAISGAVCPICVVAAPALIGVGVYRRWKTAQRDSEPTKRAR